MVAGVLVLAACAGDPPAVVSQAEREAGYLEDLGSLTSGDRDWLVLGWDACERLFNDEGVGAVESALGDVVGSDAGRVVDAARSNLCPDA